MAIMVGGGEFPMAPKKGTEGSDTSGEVPPSNGQSKDVQLTPSRDLISGIIGTIKMAREIDEVMPAQMLHVLLLIAQRPGRTVRELSELSGLSQPSISRNTVTLSPLQRPDKPGHGLVDAIEDPTERRRKIFFLTKKGRLVVNNMLQSFNTRDRNVETFQAPTADEYLNGYISRLRR
jgi:DNA-binding MarR family transcriptional regulator